MSRYGSSFMSVWGPTIVVGLITLGAMGLDAFLTLKATGDVRCLFVKCIVVK